MISPLLRERILARAGAAKVPLAHDQVEHLLCYYELLDRWNRKINLTSLPLETDPDIAVDRLIVEPLIAAAEVDESPVTWVDFGTGGGSPAIPLKIARPAAKLTMVEAKERKAAFLREVVRRLCLADARVLTARIERIAKMDSLKMEGSVDFITVRAVRVGRRIQDSAIALLRPNGRLLVFGGDMPLIFNDLRLRTVSHQALAPGAGFLSTFEKGS